VKRYPGQRQSRYGAGKKKLNEAIYRETSAAEGAANSTQSADYFNLNNAQQKAYRYLSLRAHSAKEIEKKLWQKGFSAAVIKEALEKLCELKYLDDAAFAFQWARHLAVNKLWGNRKIIASLQEKGVSAELIEAAIVAARSEIPEEAAVALLIGKKVKSLKIDDACHFDRREKSFSEANENILKIPRRFASWNDTEEVIYKGFDAAKRNSIPGWLKEKKKIFQSLLGRGFPAGLILNKLGKIPEEDIHGEDGQ
jgi:regulatory protein